MTNSIGGDAADRIRDDGGRGTGSGTAGWFAGGGDMARRIQAFDWAAHPLGPMDAWPQSLKIVVGIMLTSRYAMWLGWGRELYFFCNDAYLPSLGIKESWALGAPACEVWEEVWSDIGRRADWVLETGGATWDESLLLFLERSGMREETYQTFSYSPIIDDAGEVGGILCVVTEETDQVIGERRMRLMREIRADLAATRTESGMMTVVRRRFETQPEDVPFALLYLFEADARHAVLACAHGVIAGSSIAPERIEFASPTAAWPAEDLLRGRVPVRVDLTAAFEQLSGGAWDRPAREALVVPLAQQGQEQAMGFLVAGVNPYRPLDSSYRGFIELLAAQVASGLAAARTYETERRRAEALAELDRARTDFFNNVSHELRTPLTLMLGPLEDELQQGGSPSPRVRTAYRHSRRLLKLVNTLLDLSRLEAGRLQGWYRPVDLAELTAGFASVFRSTIEQEGLTFTIECPPLPEPAYVDTEMWEKIVLNLLGNALNFTFDGGIRVTLRPAPPMVELEVADTGVGIPADELPRVFDRFHRVRGTRSRVLEGTGIGLALVQELARLHGGDVSVRSVEGEGTTFTVRIRSGAAHLPPERLAAATAVSVDPDLWLPLDDSSLPWAAEKAPARTAMGRILIADDHADMREYLRSLLVDTYEVEAVGDGSAALEAARQHRPDLVLCDAMMPELDGLGLLRALREDESLRTIPVLLLSAHGGEAARLEGLDAGADDYLVKPFSARELQARVRSMLALARFRAEAAEREATLRDVAEERHREAQFQSAVLEQVSDAVVAADLDGCVTYVNAAAERQYQRRADEVLGRPLRDFYDYRWLRPQDEVQAYRALDEGQTWRGENLHVIRDGSVLLVESVVSPLRDEDGRITGWLAVIRDITERRQAERALRQSEERLRLATQAGKLGVWDWHIAEDTLTWTDSVYAIHGLDWGTFTPTTEAFWKLVHPEDRPAVELAVQRALAGERDYEVDFRALRPNGETVWVFSNARVFREQGRPVRMLGATIDMSERKQIELALRESEERYRAASRAKDDFLAALSHELRTPLNPVMLLASDAAENPSLSADVRSLFETIRANVSLEARLIDDLLDLTRITQGKFNLDLRVMDVHEVLEEALRIVNGELVEKRLSLGLDFRAPRRRTRADPVRLQQVFWNVLKNAVKFTPPHGRLDLVTCLHPEDDQRMCIAVTDSGIGLAPEEVDRIFEAFAQGRHHLGGLGLGLAISRMLIESQGGTIRAESAGRGRGATFTIELPLVPGGVEEEAPRGVGDPWSWEATRRGPAAGPAAWRSVLLIEDHAATRAALGHLLASRQFTVLSAASAAEAREVARTARLDLVIADIGLPDGDGCELMAELRAAHPDLPGIALSGYGMEEDRERSRRFGFGEHLTKPVNVRTLERAMGRLLDGGRG